MIKTSAVAYFDNKIKTTSRSTLIAQIEDAPLKDSEKNFLYDIIKGMSYKELSVKYKKSEARIYQIKRDIFERMTRFDRQKLI